MDMLLTNESPAYVDYINRHYHHLQKFYLVLHHADGTEYDGISCLSCLPWCRKPLYRPGQHISGHILIRPMQKMIITGVKILFEGIYKTKWKDKEHGLKWFGVHSFYKDYVHLISNRVIHLDRKWYKFDFEHVLPQKLLSSMAESECEILYHAAGCLTHTLDTDHVQTPYTRFLMHAPVNIHDFPKQLLQPVTRSAVQVFDPTCISESCYKQNERNGNNQIIIQNQCYRSESCNEGVSLPSRHTSLTSLRMHEPGCAADNEVIATLWLNKRVFAAGEDILMELNVDNVTMAPVQARLTLCKITQLKANYALKKNSREVLISLDTHVEKAIRKIEGELWSGTIGANSVESVTVNFKVPCKTAISLPKLRMIHPCDSSDDGGDTHEQPIIQCSYNIQLELVPQWDKAAACTAINLEVWIASRDHARLSTGRGSVGRNDHITEQGQCTWDATELITYSDQRESNLECDLTIETSLDEFALHDNNMRTRSQSLLSAEPTDSEGPPAYQAESANTV